VNLPLPILWEEATKQATSGSVVFMTFVVFNESKRIAKLLDGGLARPCARRFFQRVGIQSAAASEKLGPPRGGPSFLIGEA
jgi:hypothetical protein